ncbi:Uu.00g107430.m01.CDS01 [Anthostomella pinea]|uniref:Uu.00g107430.m01.CDS01 n=1 Tax=Anthostomella pinea TaxID=933095 RepID=A0AAI8VEU1_9PEZI|nr:Uu.00g107430.m01.CDS01 [Anthostomella pinea]
MATGAPSEMAQTQAHADSSGPSFESHDIRTTRINEGPGVTLSQQQKVLVGSVLDLFEGNPTLKHLGFWSRNALFTDPLTVAQGYDKYAAQWYGLPAVFSPIKIQNHTVTSAGNPIEMNLSNKYVVKGIKKEQVIDSVVRIHVGNDGKIDKVEDRWNNKLPEGSISEAFRKLNAVTVPTIVKVPKNDEEDMKMKAVRDAKSS